MTYTEIIDNIQTRIENLIAERFSGTYQHITIEPSDYNPDIDDEITVTITVTDQNNDPITDWTVPLLINGSAITGTLTTNNQGVATYTHTCNEWGVCRFSVKSFTCFINVTGWKRVVNQANQQIQVYTDGETCQFSCQGSINIRANGNTSFAPIPSQYAPQIGLSTVIHGSTFNIQMMIASDGNITVYNTSSQTSAVFRVTVTYALKSKLI